jgi:hypothetical protein
MGFNPNVQAMTNDGNMNTNLNPQTTDTGLGGPSQVQIPSAANSGNVASRRSGPSRTYATTHHQIGGNAILYQSTKAEKALSRKIGGNSPGKDGAGSPGSVKFGRRERIHNDNVTCNTYRMWRDSRRQAYSALASYRRAICV